jgi:hypothetical protein
MAQFGGKDYAPSLLGNHFLTTCFGYLFGPCTRSYTNVRAMSFVISTRNSIHPVVSCVFRGAPTSKPSGERSVI